MLELEIRMSSKQNFICYYITCCRIRPVQENSVRLSVRTKLLYIFEKAGHNFLSSPLLGISIILNTTLSVLATVQGKTLSSKEYRSK